MLSLPADAWFVVQVAPQSEIRVASFLEHKGYQPFAPTYLSRKRWSDRIKTLEKPLFPGYVFVQIALRDKLQVLKVPGVVQLISFNGRPAALPDAEIEALRSGLARSVATEPHPYLVVGKKVRVHHGPFAGVEGILIRRKDKFRVVLSIHLIQRSVAVEVDETEIEPTR